MEFETGEQWGKSIFKVRLDFVDYLEICKYLGIPDPAVVTPMHRYTILSAHAARLTAIEKAARGYSQPGETQASVSQAMTTLNNIAALYKLPISKGVFQPVPQAAPNGGVPWDQPGANPLADIQAAAADIQAEYAKLQGQPKATEFPPPGTKLVTAGLAAGMTNMGAVQVGLAQKAEAAQAKLAAAGAHLDEVKAQMDGVGAKAAKLSELTGQILQGSEVKAGYVFNPDYQYAPGDKGHGLFQIDDGSVANP